MPKHISSTQRATWFGSAREVASFSTATTLHAGDCNLLLLSNAINNPNLTRIKTYIKICLPWFWFFFCLFFFLFVLFHVTVVISWGYIYSCVAMIVFFVGYWSGFLLILLPYFNLQTTFSLSLVKNKTQGRGLMKWLLLESFFNKVARMGPLAWQRGSF